MPRPYEAFDRGTNRLRSCYAAVRPGGGTRVAPVAYIEHQIPGRVRLRIPERRGDAAFFQRIVGTLSKLPDVTELDGSPLTGSIRIRHKGPSEAIMAAAGKEGLFEIGKREGEAEPKKPPEQSGASTTAPHGDAGTLDSIATGLSGLALFQVAQGEVTGSAAENFWNAYGAQRLLRNTAITAGFGLLGVYQLLQGQWLGSASSLFFYALVARQIAAFDRAAGAMMERSEPPKPAAELPKPPGEAPKPARRRRSADKAAEKTGVSD